MVEAEKGSRTRFRAWWPVAAFLVGALLGPGFVWRLPDLQLQRDRQRLEQAASTAQLRDEITNKLLELIRRNNRYASVRDSFLLADRSELTLEIRGRLGRELRELERGTELLQDDLYRAEENLARIENREPRDMTDLPAPAPPTNLRFQPVQ
jgi:hypothetical protein